MRRSALLAVGLSLVLAACGGDDEPTPPAVVTLSVAQQAGDAQTATVGAAVPTNPSIRLTNSNGEAVSGTSVTFSVTAGGGTITGGTATTDGTGTASVGSWTLGTTPGTNGLRATVAGTGITGNPVDFVATGAAGPPATVEKTAGDGQTATPGTAVTTPPQVTVLDEFGNPVVGQEVTFTASGDGVVEGGTQTADAQGLASVTSWTLATADGANTLTADAGSASAMFTATGTSVTPTGMSIVGGNNQGAITGTSVAVPPSVLVTGDGNVPIPGVAVDFTVLTGGGISTVAGSSGAQAMPAVQVLTDASGIATIQGWEVGTPGAQTLEASIAGSSVSPVTFTAVSGLDPAGWAGSYTGTWHINEANVTGGITMNLSTAAAPSPTGPLDFLVTMVMDFDGQVFLAGDPAAETYDMESQNGTVNFNTTSSTRWNDLTVTLEPDGTFTVNSVQPISFIARVEVTGTFTQDAVNATMKVFFNSGFQETGTWALTRN